MLTRIGRLIEYLHICGPQAALPLLRSNFVDSHQVVEINRADVSHPFFIRVRTSDLACHGQIFLVQEYAMDPLWQPQTIVDAGANIGLASIYFANQFPDARVVAVEPEQENFALLSRNCEPYPNIYPVFAALWNKDLDLNVCDIGNGAWGFVTHFGSGELARQDAAKHIVGGWTMSRLLDQFEIDQIDILKVDIEGSEKEVFSGQPSWIEKVGVLIIETHDWLKPGCKQVVTEAARGFERRWQQGENLVFARDGACIASPKAHSDSRNLH